MKAETADYLAKARTTLADARQIATLPLPHVAPREAYYAAFHAAEAYIFKHTGKVASTHRGVRSEFARLARREPRIDRELTRFLATAYQLKGDGRLRHWANRRADHRRPRGSSYHDSGPLHRHHYSSIATRLAPIARPGGATLTAPCPAAPPRFINHMWTAPACEGC